MKSRRRWTRGVLHFLWPRGHTSICFRIHVLARIERAWEGSCSAALNGEFRDRFRPAFEDVTMDTVQGKDASALDDRGLRCRKCGNSRFRVIYTRPARSCQLMRRRECLLCRTRVTTYERVAG